MAQTSIIGPLTGLRRVPLHHRVIALVSGAVGNWVGEGQAKPVSRQVFVGTSLSSRKVLGLA